MDALTNEKCTACRRDSPTATEAEVSELKPQIPEWTLLEREGIERLERIYRFANFAEALSFTNRVGALAEEEGHHPAILTEWGRVTVTQRVMLKYHLALMKEEMRNFLRLSKQLLLYSLWWYKYIKLYR